MIKFLPIKADIKNNAFENAQYLPFVLDLLFKNKHLLVNDYFPQNDAQLLDYLVEEINAVYPWFIVGVLNEQPIGVAWITHWHGFHKKSERDTSFETTTSKAATAENYHSCQLHGCIDRKYWGKTSLYSVEELLNFLHINTGVIRIQMEIPEFNSRAVNFSKRAGFQEEGIIRCAAIKNGKPLNHILMSRILGY